MSDSDRKVTIPASLDSSVLYPLSRIVNDLWGEAAVAPAEIKPAAAPKTENTPSPSTEQPEQQKSFPEFGKLWIAADETIEWTEALVRTTCPDGMMPQESWAFYHTQAEKVLNGDLDAYHTVLQHCAPLADLTPYASAYEVEILDADTLDVTFECMPAYMGNDQHALRQYVSGLSLRVARDLLALLPATRVHVHANFVGSSLLEVTFTRDALRSLRFGFIDPEQTAKDAGGIFAGDQ